MANQTSLDRIEKSAKFLATPTAQAARGYLERPLETALKVLDCFADGKPHDYSEIAEATGLAENTVKGVIRALTKGGYPLTFTHAMVKADTGRKPIAVQTKKRSKQ